MALNQQVFKTRTLTAIIFVIVMLSGLLISRWTFAILFFVIHWGCWTEFDNLYKKIDPRYAEADLRMTSLPRLIGCGFLVYCLPHHYELLGVELYFIGLLIMGVGGIKFISLLLRAGQEKMAVLKVALIGLLYITLSWGAIINLRFIYFLSYPIGLEIALVLVGAIWVNDTMQYIVGSLIGKTPFSKISPNKTLEGTVGGSLLCIIAISLIGYFTSNTIGGWGYLVISLIAALVGTIGDLLESKLKRMAGVKDSGSFMPGHGGFLDRFDSLILSVPILWLVVYIWFWRM